MCVCARSKLLEQEKRLEAVRSVDDDDAFYPLGAAATAAAAAAVITLRVCRGAKKERVVALSLCS